MQMIHGFAFESHFFPLISTTANPQFRKHKDDPVDVEIETSITVHPIENKSDRLFIELRVKLQGAPEKTPYQIDVIAACFVSTQDDANDASTKEAVSNIAYKILYPSIRELVLMLTARQPWGQFSIGIDTDDEIKSTPKKKPRKKRLQEAIND